MPSVAQVNAELQEVAAVGGYEDYGEAGTAGDPKFTGNAGVYYRQKRERRTEGGNSNVVIGRTLTVPLDLGIEWEEGDVVTLRRRGKTFTPPAVKLVEEIDPVAGQPGTVRLTLEDE